MDRRIFLAAASTQLVSVPFTFGQDREPITIEGKGITIYPPDGDKPLRITGESVKINGITIPAFSASWVGLQLAAGILFGAGGVIFKALLTAIGGGPSIQELLQKQLEAIAEIVKKNEIRKCAADLDAIRRTMVEYMNAPTDKDRLKRATDDSQVVVSHLKSFGFETYNELMCAGSLRLAILHERAKLDKAEKKNYNAFIDDNLVDHHKKIVQHIATHTSLDGVIRASLPPNLATATKGPLQDVANASVLVRLHTHIIEQQILGVPVKSIPRVSKDSKAFADQANFLEQRHDKLFPGFRQTRAGIRANLLKALEEPGDKTLATLIDWPKFRQSVESKTTVAGAKMVADWNESKKVVDKL